MINKIIFSQWNKPALDFMGRHDIGWLNEKYQWMGLALSAYFARKALVSGCIEFYTDDYGCKMVEQFGIPFDHIDICLEGVDLPPSLWSAGKFIAMLKQTEPFLHIDSDVFITKPIPEQFLSAPLLYQSNEDFLTHTWYEGTLKYMNESPLFKGNFYYATGIAKGIRYAFNCGIIGGTDIEFIKKYASVALDMTEANRDFFSQNPDGFSVVVVEQWMLTVMAIIERVKAINLIWSPTPPGVTPESIGYHHYIAGNKRKESLMLRMSAILKSKEPAIWQRIEEHFSYANQNIPIGGEL